MGIQSGKLPVIYDDDPRLSDAWKGRPAGENIKMDPLVGSGGDQGSDGPTNPNRPQRSDIVLKDIVEQLTDSNVERRKAIFRIYNSSKEKIDGLSFALTLSDKEGGRP